MSAEDLLGELRASNIPVSVYGVYVDGARFTSLRVLEPHIRPITTAKTVSELLQRINTASSALLGLQVFDDVHFNLEEGIRVRVSVEEKKWYKLAGHVTLDDQDGGSVGLKLALRNLFRNADRWRANVSSTSINPLLLEAGLSYPVSSNPNNMLDLDVHHTLRTNQSTSSHDWDITGTQVSYSMLGRHWKTHLGVDMAMRQVCHPGRKASPEVRKECGTTTKSALSATWQYDTRDSAPLPTKGYYFKTGCELAVPPMDTHHVKQESEAQVSIPISKYMTFATRVQGGILFPFSRWAAPASDTVAAQTRTTSIVDRFCLGGVSGVRGFWYKPMHVSERDILGGDLYWAHGASLFLPAPMPGSLEKFRDFRTHIFVNSGNSVRWKGKEDTREAIRGLASTKPVVTAGAGLVYQWGSIRFELSYVFPVTKNDSFPIPKLQFGFGTNFL